MVLLLLPPPQITAAGLSRSHVLGQDAETLKACSRVIMCDSPSSNERAVMTFYSDNN